MTRLLQRLGGWCATHPVLVIGGWVVAAAVTAALAATVGGAYAQGSTLPGTEVQAAQSRLSARFPAAADTSADVLLHGSSPGVVAAAVPRVRAGVVGLPHVVASSVAVAARSADGRTLLVHVRYDVPRFTLHTRDLRALQAVARSGGVTKRCKFSRGYFAVRNGACPHNCARPSFILINPTPQMRDVCSKKFSP